MQNHNISTSSKRRLTKGRVTKKTRGRKKRKIEKESRYRFAEKSPRHKEKTMVRAPVH